MAADATALLARLQIPVLKAAMLDGAFGLEADPVTNGGARLENGLQSMGSQRVRHD